MATAVAPVTSGTLDEILFDIPEPKRTDVLTEFMENEDTVKLKAAMGPMPAFCRLTNRVYSFPPAGHSVSRRVAVELLEKYGRGGKYRFKNQATGISKSRLAAMKPDEKSHWEAQGVKITDNYIYHVNTIDDNEE